MRKGTTVLTISGLLLLAACTRTIVVQPPALNGPPPPERRGSRPPPRSLPEPDRPPPPAPPPVQPVEPPRSTAVTLGIPPGHLPDPGECRVWIPGVPPGQQPRPRSRPCAGIAAVAPAGSWIVYRPGEDRRVVHVRLVDERRPGIVTRIRIFDLVSERLIREEQPQADPGDVGVRPRDQQPPPPGPPGYRPPPPQQRPPDQPPPVVKPREEPPQVGAPPPVQAPPPQVGTQQPPQVGAPPPEQRPLPPPEIVRPVPQPDQPPPGAQPPQPPPEQRPPENRPPEPPPGPSGNVTLNVPPGHLPELGECRVWIPGLPPGRQPRPKSRRCDGIASVAPAGSWILYRPSDDEKVVHVRLVDARRAGVVIRVRIFDIDSKRLLREESP
jgi:hypothetical protein